MPVSTKNARCPQCTVSLTVEAKLVAKRVRCPKCGHEFSVSFSNQPQDAESTLKKTQQRETSLESTKDAIGNRRTVNAGASSSGSSSNYSEHKAIRSEASIGRLGRFELKGVLGQGAFGRVYRAYDPQLDRVLALKVPLFGDDERQKGARFRSEAKAAGRLRHPNIVPVFDSGKIGGRHFIASQYIEGQPLSAVSRSKSTDIAQAAQWVASIARALDYAHKMGIVHRDVKPQNIMLDSAGQPQLMDFGLAKRVNDDAAMTTEGSLLGTPAYMSPEQVRGETATVGPLSDQYAAGTILYELLVGERAFDGPAHAVLAQILSSEPTPIGSLNPTIPKDLQAIVEKAMSKEAGDRYVDCQALASDLENWLRGEPIVARTSTTLEQLRRWGRRNRQLAIFACLLGGVILLSMLGISGALVRTTVARAQADLNWAEAQRQTDIAQQQTRNAEEQRALAEEQRVVAEQQRLLAEQHSARAEENNMKMRKALALSSFAQGVREYEAGEERGAMQNLVRGEALLAAHDPLREGFQRVIIDRCLRGGKQLLPALRHSQAVTCLALSPNGRLILTGSSDRTARIWDAHSGLPVGLPLQHEASISQVAFSPSGILAATSSFDKTVGLWDVRDGKRSGNALIHGAAVNDLCFSPDGQLLVTACAMGSAFVWDLNSRSSSPQELKHGSPVKFIKYCPRGDIIATCDNDGRVQLWNPRTGLAVGDPLKPSGRTVDLMFSPDGRCLATKGNDYRCRLWNVASGELIGAPMVHSQTPTGWCFNADSTRLVTGCFDKQIRFWDTSNAELVGPALHNDQSILRVALSPDGTRLATSSESTIQFWDLERLQKVGSPVKHLHLIEDMQFSLDSQRLISASRDHSTIVWRVDGKTAEKRMFHLNSKLIDAVLSPDQKRIAIGDREGVVSQFDMQTQREIGPSINHGAAIRSLAYSPNASILASGQWTKGMTRLWNTSTNTPMKVELPQEANVYGVAFSPNGASVATASGDGSVRVWNCLTGDELLSPLPLKFNEPEVPAARSVAFSSNGRFIVIGQAENAQIWDVQNRGFVGAPCVHPSTVTSAIFSPDDSRLLTGAADGTARQWDATSGLQIGNPMLHPSSVIRATYSLDGNSIATATVDGRVQLWDADTGTEISEPLQHSNNVMNVAFTAKGDQLMTAVLEEGVYLWKIAMFPTEQFDASQLAKAVQIWTGLVADSDGNTRELTVAETDRIRSELGGIDALTAFQTGGGSL